MYPWICFQLLITNPDFLRFVLVCGPQIRIRFVLWMTNPDLKRVILSRGSRIQPMLKRINLFYESHKSSQIFKNPYYYMQYNSLKIKHKSGFVNPSPWVCFKLWLTNPTCFQTTHIVDLICRPVFKKFVSWIWFVRPKISKCLIRSDS